MAMDKTRVLNTLSVTLLLGFAALAVWHVQHPETTEDLFQVLKHNTTSPHAILSVATSSCCIPMLAAVRLT